MTRLSRRAVLVVPVALAHGGVFAQSAGPTRVRGIILTLAGDALTVRTRDGASVVVTLAEPTTIVTLRRVALAEITPGTAVGAVAEPGEDGVLKAVAITVLPPGARINERQFAWDTGPNSSMNDGPVEAVVEAGSGRELTLGIAGRSVRLRVGADTPLLMPVPAARADLVPGAVVFINAARGGDGQLSTTRVTVGKDGVVPVI